MSEIEKVDFDLSRAEPLIVRYVNGSGSTVSVTSASVDFQDKGITVESFEPNPPDSQVRHVAFVPYSSLVDIRQDYVV